MSKKNKANQRPVKRLPAKRSKAKRNKALLRDAPAQEAIYTIRAIFAVPVELANIRTPLHEALNDVFATVEDFTAFQTTVNQPASENPTVQSETRAMGFRFKTTDGTHVAHFMLDGLVVNWLKTAYPGYEQSVESLKRYWKLYLDHFRPLGVDHVTLRYINHLQLPLNDNGLLQFSDYLLNGPTLPTIGGLAFNGYQQYTELTKQPEGIRTRVMTATLNPIENRLPVLFDHESFLTLTENDRREQIPIWKAFNTLHAWSSTFFQQTLTTRCHALFS